MLNSIKFESTCFATACVSKSVQQWANIRHCHPGMSSAEGQRGAVEFRRCCLTLLFSRTLSPAACCGNVPRVGCTCVVQTGHGGLANLTMCYAVLTCTCLTSATASAVRSPANSSVHDKKKLLFTTSHCFPMFFHHFALLLTTSHTAFHNL